jgi:succinate-semialdehyde dehydrogenase/glutarate-semialdehyde dehydrogenase
MMMTGNAEIRTRNPSTGESLRVYHAHSAEEIQGALDRAREAQRAWAAVEQLERAEMFRRIATFMRAKKMRLATMITTEMGKPIVEAQAEIEKCALTCEHYAEHAQMYTAAQPVASTATRSYVAFRPLGVILAIMPWNFPFWQVFRAAVPALMAGNALVLKHAANVTACALEIERIFTSCAAPAGLLTTLLVPGSEMEAVIADPHIAAVTFTGSESAGAAVAAIAGKYLKKTVLELGGSDAFIVLADADVEEAAAVAVRARFQNTGQSCIAAKRFIVENAVYDRFADAFVNNAKTLVIGDPLDPTTRIGPLARADILEEIERQVHASLLQGAKSLLGAHILTRPGYYYAPTILGDVTTTMPAFTQETFGPAAALIRAHDADHAVELANASPFGLGGSLWTRDIERAEKLAAVLESGAVFINGMTASDPRLPFGGVKRSGYGRELSHFGIQEFVNVQTVWVG